MLTVENFNCSAPIGAGRRISIVVAAALDSVPQSDLRLSGR